MIPERRILTLVQTGIDAIKATPGYLDAIIGASIPADELTKAKAKFVSNPPTLVLGFPRQGAALPCYAMTLASDEVMQDYLGQGEEAILDDFDVVEGNRFKRRFRGVFTFYVYTEHPDWCTWLYRVLQRILNMGTPFLVAGGLDDPVVAGADLVPDPRYTPENVYVRRLTLSLEYEDDWNDLGGLWAALNGATEDRGELGPIIHEDVGGGAHPYIASKE